MSKLLAPKEVQDPNYSSDLDDETGDELCDFSDSEDFNKLSRRLSIRRKVEAILEEKRLKNEFDDFFDL